MGQAKSRRGMPVAIGDVYARNPHFRCIDGYLSQPMEAASEVEAL